MKVNGLIEQVSLKSDNRFSVMVAGEWFGAFGKCEVKKGDFVEVDFEKKGQWNNVRRIKKVDAGFKPAEDLKVKRELVQEKKVLDAENFLRLILNAVSITAGLSKDLKDLKDSDILTARILVFSELCKQETTKLIQSFKEKNIKEMKY